jgi:hypothetical protein
MRYLLFNRAPKASSSKKRLKDLLSSRRLLDKRDPDEEGEKNPFLH